jgi:hypothetical protein
MYLASAGWRATKSLTMTIGNLENFDIKTLKITGTPFINAKAADMPRPRKEKGAN